MSMCVHKCVSVCASMKKENGSMFAHGTKDSSSCENNLLHVVAFHTLWHHLIESTASKPHPTRMEGGRRKMRDELPQLHHVLGESLPFSKYPRVKCKPNHFLKKLERK